jgi:DNA-binding beta-propeller fold protein YncE
MNLSLQARAGTFLTRARFQLAALAVLFGSVAAQNADQVVPLDNLKERSVHWNAHLIAPLLISRDGTKLYAINQSGQRLAIFALPSLTKIGDVPVGPGLVSMAQRPGTSELWLVDKVAGSVSVYDLPSRTIVRSIRVGAEPHGIAFTTSGDRAYVACSGVARVDVVDAVSFTIATSIAIPALEPRAIVYLQGAAWVVPLLSGNNTAPMGEAQSGPDLDKIVEVGALASFPGLNQLPDRDLLAIPTQAAPGQDQLDPAKTRTGLGTLLLNVHARPGTSELWIPNTDALNAVHKGEKNFVQGQCVANRITIVDVAGAAAPQFVDLDALAPPQRKCAQPTGLAFDPVRPRVYVCGYGSDRIAVLDTSGAAVTWAGSIDVPYLGTYPELAGPRACVVDALGKWLYILNKGNTSLTRVDLPSLPSSPSFAVTAPLPISLGWDSVAGAERFGRNDLVNGKNSKSQTTSCASCHVDGHLDGLVWNLGRFLDPEGTPNALLGFPADDKGPMTTQSVRRLFETGPYHWRGEVARLKGFNGAFINLMEREVNGVPADLGAHFSYLENYMRRVAYPPNPRQALDRSFDAEQLEGAQLFQQKKVAGQATCASCHQLPLGTSGELVASHVRGVFDMADVPQLRGLLDRLSPPYFIGGGFGTRTELGAGLSHGGAFPTVRDLLLAPHPTLAGQQSFKLTPAEADAIAAFLSAFDTGLAPATGYLATANSANAGTFQSTELAFLMRQAESNCDLIFRGSPQLVGGATVWPSGLYDPKTGTFRVAQAGAPAVTVQSLMADAAAGHPVTFVGVPLWMGLPLALDRDLDELYDLDELALGTDPEDFDTDGDDFPDGYEVLWGMDPFAGGSVSPDTQPPTLVGAPRLIYATTNTLKFEFQTSEAANALIGYNGLAPVLRLPLQSKFDSQFSVILNELEPGTSYTIQLFLADPAGQTSTPSFTFATRPRTFPAPVYVDDIALAVAQQGGVVELQATVQLLAAGSPPAPGYVARADVHFEGYDGRLTPIAVGAQQPLAGGSGVLTFHVPLPASDHVPGKLHFVMRSMSAPAGQPPYARPLNKETWDSIAW